MGAAHFLFIQLGRPMGPAASPERRRRHRRPRRHPTADCVFVLWNVID